MTRTKTLVARALFLFVLGLMASIAFITSGSCAYAQTPGKMSAPAFHDAMRKLWEDHIVYTRLYIVSDAGNLPDKAATAARLLQNQVDIGNAVKPYYGVAAGNALTSLLKQHILGAVAILDAAKAGDKAKQNAATAAWFANADAIAAFLSKANPKNWPLAAVKAQMHMHLNLTLTEATAQLTGDYPGSIAAYDRVTAHILGLADILSGGIMRQFPAKFSGPRM